MVYFMFYSYNVILSLFKNKFIYYFSLLPICILIFGLRDKVGYDWGVYELAFYNPGIIPFEIGFEALNRIVYFIFGDFNVLVFIVFLFTTIINFKSLEYFSENYNVALIGWIGTSLLSFGIMRQSIAMSIFIYSLRYIDNNKKKYNILIIIASLFHISSIAMIFAPIVIKNKQIDNKNISVLMIIGIIFYTTNILHFVISKLIFIPYIGPKFELFLSNTVYSSKLGLGVRLYETIGIVALCSIYKMKLEKKNKYFNLFYNISISYIFIYLTLNSMSVIAVRYMKYLEIGNIILVSYLVSILDNKYSKVIISFIIFIYFGMKFYLTLTGGLSLQDNSTVFFPYNNIMFN